MIDNGNEYQELNRLNPFRGDTLFLSDPIAQNRVYVVCNNCPRRKIIT